MKPLSPAQMVVLKRIERNITLASCWIPRRTLASLHRRGLIELVPGSVSSITRPLLWQLTDAGRRVLAEHPTTGGE
jgi:hypothetical protein